MPSIPGVASSSTIALLYDAHNVPILVGQRPAAASLSVVLASDQAAIPISGAPSTVTANQGVAQVVANSWPMRPTDGANTQAMADIPSRAGYQRLVDASGVNVAAVTAGNLLKVDGSSVTQPVSGTATVTQGTPAAAANRWPVQITDGTNLAAVTAAGLVKVDASFSSGPVVVSAQQGTAAAAAGRWPVQITDGTNVAGVTAGGLVKVDGSGVAQPVSGSLSVVQSTPAAAANRWPVQITDGTNLAGVTAAGVMKVDAAFSSGVLSVSAQQSTPAAAANRWPVQLTDGTNLSVVSAAGALSVDTELPAAAALADAAANPTAPFVAAANAVYNGATWDLRRGNIDATALASLARTATPGTVAVTNFNHRGIIVYLNVTAVSGAVSLSVRILANDPVSGSFFQAHAAVTAVTGTGLFTYVIYPGLSATAFTQATSGVIGRGITLQVVHGNGISATYSLGYSLVV